MPHGVETATLDGKNTPNMMQAGFIPDETNKEKRIM
jgi:hypothetical protein